MSFHNKITFSWIRIELITSKECIMICFPTSHLQHNCVDTILILYKFCTPRKHTNNNRLMAQNPQHLIQVMIVVMLTWDVFIWINLCDLWHIPQIIPSMPYVWEILCLHTTPIEDNDLKHRIHITPFGYGKRDQIQNYCMLDWKHISTTINVLRLSTLLRL